jgi:hypothetical protein
VHVSRYEAYGRVLSGLRDELLTGEVVSERATVERLVRVVGALLRLHDRHRIDARGWCAVCRPVPRTWRRPRPKRSTCTVHAALSYFLPQQPSQESAR